MSKIVYISIGNSDDKLSQARWAEFIEAIREALSGAQVHVHGAWMSLPDSPWQNACWCIELSAEDWIKEALRYLAASFGQDSIAWAEVQRTEFLGENA